jgi:PAS domain S-box-containing protein
MQQLPLHILVIEDNPGDFLLVSEYLEEAFDSADISQAETLKQGLHLLENHSFDVILLDLTLPDGMGINSFHSVNSRFSEIPIIILTGLGDTDVALESMKDGAQDFIVKDNCNSTILSNSIKYSIERSKFMQHLQRSEEQYKSLFNNNPLPLIAFDYRTHKLLMVNQAAVQCYGYHEDEFLKMTISELESGKGLNGQKQKYANNEDIDLQHQTKDGNVIDVEMRIHTIQMNGTNAGLAVIHDVTERNKAREEQRRIEAEKEMLIEELTQHNSDLKQFSYIASHNLRAPLANLLAIIQLLDIDSIPDPNTALLLKNFEECTNQLNETVNDLLQVLVIKNNVDSQKELLDIRKIFERVLSSVQNAIEQNDATVNADFDHAYNVEFNRSYLESILLNLLTNAIKYRSPKRPLEINVRTEKNDDRVTLYFSDNGLGIDLQRYKDRIFGLYQTFHQHSDSKGLGLYIVNSQIRVMGGEIDVESEVDKGTTFIIKFKN